MFNPMALNGKRILVTGASSGIGRACAVMAAKLGAETVLVARRPEALEETRQLLAEPTRHQCVTWDFASGEDLGPLMRQATERGKLSGLVHAAGIGPAMPIGMLDVIEARRVMEVNWLSFLGLMRFCSKKRTAEEGFSAVAVSSIAADVGWGGVAVYAGSKGAVSASVRALSAELAPKKIRVNAVCPSTIRTPMFESVEREMNDAGALAMKLKRQPLGLGEPEQVAAAACFLLSEAASFITGVNLPVDGGYLAQ